MRFNLCHIINFSNILFRKLYLRLRYRSILIKARLLSHLIMDSKAESTTTVTSRTPLTRASAPPARWICFNDYEELESPRSAQTDCPTCCKKTMFAFPVVMVLLLTAFCYYVYVVELCICMLKFIVLSLFKLIIGYIYIASYKFP